MDLRRVNFPDFSTDKFVFSEAECAYSGIVDEHAGFIENFDLKDKSIWKRFVEQYKMRSDTDDFGWRGEYWGKMMRGASFLYAYTKTPELYDVLEGTVRDMMTVADSDGSVTTYAPERRFTGWDIWSRKYVLLGMQYFIEICGDDKLIAEIVAFMTDMTDDIMKYIGEGEGMKNITHATNHWRGLNSSSLLEPVVRLYRLSGEQRFLDFAKYIVDCGGTSVKNIFELAYEDEFMPYQYPATKAYEMTSCFEGLLEYYRITKEEKYKTAIVNFANRVLENDFTVIGCGSCGHELFDHSTVRQASEHPSAHMQETCVTVTLMKFFAKLNLLTGDSRFMDAFERSLYNAYFGAVNTDCRVPEKWFTEWEKTALNSEKTQHKPLPFDSYSPLTPGTRGVAIGGCKIMPDGHYYGCCACIGAAGIGMVPMYQLPKTSDGYVMNLYINGSVKADGVTFRTVTEYPKSGIVNITVETDKSGKFALYLRNPEWSKKTVFCINGEHFSFGAAGGYIRIERVWNSGDAVTVEFDMRTEVIYPIPFGKQILMNDVAWGQNYMIPSMDKEDENAKRRISLRRGPLMLAVENRLGRAAGDIFDVKINKDGYVDVRFPEKNTAPYKNIVELEVPDNKGGYFTVTDYSSAGKTWDEDSRMAVWFFNK